MRKSIALLLALVLLCGIVPAASAASDEAIAAADTLHELGLFNGTGTNADGTPNYDLDRAPTRNEAVTMLVRLLGKEEEAKAGAWALPFTDVADWAKPYVGYAYANRLTSGTGTTTFDGESLVTASQYITFVLRALGYDSSTDFKWDAAWELSDKIGLTNGTYGQDGEFIRGDVAIVSKNALAVNLKGANQTLLESLGLKPAEPIKLSPENIQGYWTFNYSNNSKAGLYIQDNKYYFYNCSLLEGAPGYYNYSCEVGTIEMSGEELLLTEETSFTGTYTTANVVNISSNTKAENPRTRRIYTDGQEIKLDISAYIRQRVLTRADSDRYLEMTKANIVGSDDIYGFLVKAAKEKGTLEDGIYKYKYDSDYNIDSTRKTQSLREYFICYDPNRAELSIAATESNSLTRSRETTSIIIDPDVSGYYLVKTVSYDWGDASPTFSASAHVNAGAFTGVSKDIVFEEEQGSVVLAEYSTAFNIKTAMLRLNNTFFKDTMYKVEGLGFWTFRFV